MIRRFVLSAMTVLLGVAAMPLPVSAASPVSAPTTQFAVCTTGIGNFFGIQPWYACLPKNAAGDPEISDINHVFLIIFPLVESLVKIGALVAAGIIFYMLIRMITARGNAGTIANAAEGIRDAIIGLIICIAAVAVVNFIAGRFTAF